MSMNTTLWPLRPLQRSSGAERELHTLEVPGSSPGAAPRAIVREHPAGGWTLAVLLPGCGTARTYCGRYPTHECAEAAREVLS